MKHDKQNVIIKKFKLVAALTTLQMPDVQSQYLWINVCTTMKLHLVAPFGCSIKTVKQHYGTQRIN